MKILILMNLLKNINRCKNKNQFYNKKLKI